MSTPPLKNPVLRWLVMSAALFLAPNLQPQEIRLKPSIVHSCPRISSAESLSDLHDARFSDVSLVAERFGAGKEPPTSPASEGPDS